MGKHSRHINACDRTEENMLKEILEYQDALIKRIDEYAKGDGFFRREQIIRWIDFNNKNKEKIIEKYKGV